MSYSVSLSISQKVTSSFSHKYLREVSSGPQQDMDVDLCAVYTAGAQWGWLGWQSTAPVAGKTTGKLLLKLSEQKG